MRTKVAVILFTLGMFGLADGGLSPLSGQVAPGFMPSPTPTAAAAGDAKSVLFRWKWYLGMLRSPKEKDSITSLEVWKSTGTILVGGQPCTLTNYRASINYQVGGMRAQYDCKLANGQTRHGIEVVSGQYAWDEDVLGAGLIAGKGTATSNPGALNERLIRLWASPQGAAKAAGFSCSACLEAWPSWARPQAAFKAAVAGGPHTKIAEEIFGTAGRLNVDISVPSGAETKVAMEVGKPVVTYSIPFVTGAIAKATLNADNEAERVEVRQGNVVTEFTYDKYEDCNPPDDKYAVLFPRHMVEKRNGVTILDLNVVETQEENIYVIMPVPDSVRKAFAGEHGKS
jgi:hypothetical protein